MEETNREKMVSENSAVHKIPTKHSFPKIDKEMIRFKGHFFFFYGVAGTMTPYLPLIARKRLKLTATSLATILTAQVFITILSKPLIGYLADYFNRMKLILSTLLVLLSIFYLLLLIIPPIEKYSEPLKPRSSEEFLQFVKNLRKIQIKNQTENYYVRYKDKNGYDVLCLLFYYKAIFSGDNETNVITLESKNPYHCLINALQFKEVTSDETGNVSCHSLFDTMYQVLNKSLSCTIFINCFLRSEILIGTKNDNFRTENTSKNQYDDVCLSITNETELFCFLKNNGTNYTLDRKNHSCCNMNMSSFRESDVNKTSNIESSLFDEFDTVTNTLDNDSYKSLLKKINRASNESSCCIIFLVATNTLQNVLCQPLIEEINQISNDTSNIKYSLFKEFETLANAFDNDSYQSLLEKMNRISKESSFKIFCTATSALDNFSCKPLLQVINPVSNESFRGTIYDSGKLESINQIPIAIDFKAYQFWFCAFLMIVSDTCLSSLYTLSDTICCESVHALGKDFGKQRLYSAIGWGGLASIGGYLYDVTNNYFAIWILMVLLQCLTLWNLFKMVVIKPNLSKNILKDIRHVLKSPEFLAFNGGVLMNGMWLGAIWFFLIVFLDSLGASKFLCGFITVMQCCVGDIPFMFYSEWIINKLGHFNLISLSLLAYGIRFIWYSYLQDPWLVLPVEILHGLTSGIFYPVVANYGKLSARPGTEATTQSIIFSTHEGLGAGIGCILTGISFDNIGGHWTFFYLSLCAFCSAALNILIHLTIKRRSKILQITVQ
ncbi:uncharacterized protein [Parasteatoda tepidariorum]|nr:uncharacterized protein LOC107441656 [Parasteatoda tepidariorum]